MDPGGELQVFIPLPYYSYVEIPEAAAGTPVSHCQSQEGQVLILIAALRKRVQQPPRKGESVGQASKLPLAERSQMMNI